MKGAAAATVLLWMTTASVAEVRCQDVPGREQRGVFWSWREIDGKRCWFIRARGGMPPKSEFTWAKEKPAEEPTKEDMTPAPETAKTDSVSSAESQTHYTRGGVRGPGQLAW